MKRELEYFFAALRFFTRLPVPAWVGHSSDQLNHAARYFPLVGIIVNDQDARGLRLGSHTADEGLSGAIRNTAPRG